MAALPPVDGNPHTGQTQAAPRILTGARKDTCSENKLLTVPKAQAMTALLACRKTCQDGINPNIWKRNIGLGTTPNNRWLKGISACYISHHLSETFTHPIQEQNQHPSHNMNIWSKILEKKGQILWNNKQMLTKSQLFCRKQARITNESLTAE